MGYIVVGRFFVAAIFLALFSAFAAGFVSMVSDSEDEFPLIAWIVAIVVASFAFASSYIIDAKDTSGNEAKEPATGYQESVGVAPEDNTNG